MSSKKGGSIKYFSEDNAGFKIQPKTVLIMALVYIGLVVLLHIYSKLGSGKTTEAKAAPTDTPTSEQAQENVHNE